jgi:hypothetical protein
MSVDLERRLLTLEKVRRLSEAELEAACAELRKIPIESFVPQDPYRPLDPAARRVDVYEPDFVRGPDRRGGRS